MASSPDLEKGTGGDTPAGITTTITGASEHENEKPALNTTPSSDASPPPYDTHNKLQIPQCLRTLNNKIESLSGFEARGITRVLPSERQPPSRLSDLQIFFLWFGANISANNLTTGLFGPLIFGLGFVDSVMCAIIGCFLGSLCTAYMATWGPVSGNRTMVVLRFFMGYWTSKIPCFLNIVLMVGYITCSFIIAGQILSAVSDGEMTIVVGIVVVALVCWIVAVFGMRVFHTYERYAWIPQLLVLFVLVGSAGPKFNSGLESLTGEGISLAANRLSFLSLCLYVPNSWAAAASDYYVYYPEDTKRRKVFGLTLAGLFLSFTFVYMLGIGLASGVATNPAWEEAYGISTGALIITGFDGLAGFGKVCGVIVALSLIANSIPGCYSAALGCQVMGRYGKMVPRWVWTCVVLVVQLVCALAGREHLMELFGNFLALMGYWMTIMIFIVLMEHLMFRGRSPYDWSKWEDKSYLPLGIASLVAFLLGWVGAILGMYQVWYVGPLAELTGMCDVGVWLGVGFAIVSYLPLRFLELKFVGR